MSAEQKPPAMLEKVPRELLAVLITGSVDKANATAEKAAGGLSGNLGCGLPIEEVIL